MKSYLKSIVLSRSMAILHDIMMIPAAWLLSYWLRFNLGYVSPEYVNSAFIYLVLVIPIQVVSFWVFGLYRGVWRFASIPDLLRIFQSVIAAVLVIVIVSFMLYRMDGLPRSVPVFYIMLLVFLLGGPRFLYRWKKDHHLRTKYGKRVMIVGAGRAGEMLARDLLRNPDSDYLPVAFADDNPRRIGQDIHGIPIICETDSIIEFVDMLAIEVIVLAIPSASVGVRKRIFALCEQTGVPFRTVPQLDDLMSGQVSIGQIREVSIEDLLGREPVNLEWKAIRDGLSAKTVLVTGAGGSIGSELCRQIAKLDPTRLVLVENSEFNLYSIELELKERFKDLILDVRLLDVRDKEAIDKVFKCSNPDVVFHAAAYKHVPMLESQLRVAIDNNVLGTRIVADAADCHGVTEFVLISTDKAVNPANIMGATKRAAELYCQNLNSRSSTRYVTVRFGNVLGSAGSVVPLFRKQIENGGPVTVTHENIERYFMTIPEACQLIMQAVIQCEGGEIFVLDMGEPVKIRYLAEQMIILSGQTPNEDIDIVYTGLRPGEKLYEELFHDQEALKSTHHEKILLAGHRTVNWDSVCLDFDRLEKAVQIYDENILQEILQKLVPENRMKKSYTS